MALSFAETCHTKVLVVRLVKLGGRFHTSIKDPIPRFV